MHYRIIGHAGANRLALVTLGGAADTEYRYNTLGNRVAKAAPGGADTRQFHGAKGKGSGLVFSFQIGAPAGVALTRGGAGKRGQACVIAFFKSRMSARKALSRAARRSVLRTDPANNATTHA